MEDEHVSEELSEWEQIQSPYSTIRPLSNASNSSLFVIKKDSNSESSVFPPGNHEELPISTPRDSTQWLQEQRPTTLLPPSADDDDGVPRRKRLSWEVLQTQISRISHGVKKYATNKVGLWSFSWVLTGSFAVLFSFLLRVRVRLWWQKRVKRENSRESLMLLIKEKDKKINQLLLQIAQMNEILLARRRVQVIRV